MIGLQIIALIFLCVMIYMTYIHYHRQEIGPYESALLMIVWVGGVLIVLFPSLFKVFTESVSISRAFDFAVISAFIVTIPLVYIAYVRTRKLEKKLEEYVRQDAILKSVKKRKKSR